MRWLLILLAGLAARAAAAKPDWKRVLDEQTALHTWDPLDGQYAKETVAALTRLSSTREHLLFVKKHSIDLKVVAPGEKLSESALGCYIDEDHAMYVSEDTLMEGASELRAAGAPEGAIPGILAWKFLSTVAHEIRHGMTRARLREQGFDLRLNPLEGEYISFLDGARVFREEVKVRPELWADRSRILQMEKSNGRYLEELGKGVPALKSLVNELYPGKPSILETPRGKLAAEYRRRLSELDRYADTLLQTDVSQIEDPDVRADLADAAASITEGILLYKEMLSLLKDSARYAKLKRFYAREIETLSRSLRK